MSTRQVQSTTKDNTLKYHYIVLAVGQAVSILGIEFGALPDIKMQVNPVNTQAVKRS